MKKEPKKRKAFFSGISFPKLLKFSELFLKGLFSKKKQPPSAPPKPYMQKPGLVCPRCQFLIEMSLPMLLAGESIFCRQCYLKLTVNQKESQGTLDAVRKLDTNLKKAKKCKKIANHKVQILKGNNERVV